jgi:hypothetical protein
MQEVTARLSRRTLLKSGLVGAVLVGVGSAGLALQSTRKQGATPPLKVLDAEEYAVLCAVAETACPALGAGAPGATALEVAKQLDGLLASADPESQKGTKMALRIFDNALSGALGGERLVPFTKLDGQARTRVLANWRDSDIGFKRTVYKGLTGAIFAVYWGDPRTWKRIGYDGPPDCAQLREGYASDLVDLDRLRATPLAKGA